MKEREQRASKFCRQTRSAPRACTTLGDRCAKKLIKSVVLSRERQRCARNAARVKRLKKCCASASCRRVHYTVRYSGNGNGNGEEAGAGASGSGSVSASDSPRDLRLSLTFLTSKKESRCTREGQRQRFLRRLLACSWSDSGSGIACRSEDGIGTLCGRWTAHSKSALQSPELLIAAGNSTAEYPDIVAPDSAPSCCANTILERYDTIATYKRSEHHMFRELIRS